MPARSRVVRGSGKIEPKALTSSSNASVAPLSWIVASSLAGVGTLPTTTASRSLSARCLAASATSSGVPTSTTRGGPCRRTARRRLSRRLPARTMLATIANTARLMRGIR